MFTGTSYRIYDRLHAEFFKERTLDVTEKLSAGTNGIEDKKSVGIEKGENKNGCKLLPLCTRHVHRVSFVLSPTMRVCVPTNVQALAVSSPFLDPSPFTAQLSSILDYSEKLNPHKAPFSFRENDRRTRLMIHPHFHLSFILFASCPRL
jgi:hypothetical protein